MSTIDTLLKKDVLCPQWLQLKFMTLHVGINFTFYVALVFCGLWKCERWRVGMETWVVGSQGASSRWGHIRHSALVATAEGFACVSPPLVLHQTPHCVKLPPSWADVLLEQHCRYKSNEAWVSCSQMMDVRSNSWLCVTLGFYWPVLLWW